MAKLIGNAPNQVPTNADLGSMAFEDKVSVANLNATGTKDATTFLRGDNTFAGAGITEADQWRLTASITTNVDPISSNLERVDNTGAGYLGTGMSVASGIWTFPSTGLWRVEANITAAMGVSDAQSNLYIRQYISGVATDVVVIIVGGSSTSDSASGNFLYNVTDTATHQITFRTTSVSGTTISGSTDENTTYFTFTRLGDSV
jgi:hypothetical protein